jgi:hypothetical protein
MSRFVRMTVVLVLAVSLLAFAAPPVAPAQAEATQTYIVLYKQRAVPASAADAIATAGGTLVYSYDQIGVAIARSDSAAFRDNLLTDNRIEGAAATDGFAVRFDDEIEIMDIAAGPPAGDLPNAPAAFNDPMSNLQWDMVQIHVPEALEITGGSPEVIVGDIDTGLDYTHPDLAANVDFATSVSCLSGVPDQDPAAWMDHCRGQQRHRHRRGGPQRQDCWHQGRQCSRVFLPGGGHLRLHVGWRSPHRCHQQQLLHGPLAVQLSERP